LVRLLLLTMRGLIRHIEGTLADGKAVSVHGGSGCGKTESLEALKEYLSARGERPVYVDMRDVNGERGLYRRIASQLDLDVNFDGHTSQIKKEVYTELDEGDVSLLLDEYWAGRFVGGELAAYAQKKGDEVVAIAGDPSEADFVRYEI